MFNPTISSITVVLNINFFLLIKLLIVTSMGSGPVLPEWFHTGNGTTKNPPVAAEIGAESFNLKHKYHYIKMKTIFLSGKYQEKKH